MSLYFDWQYVSTPGGWKLDPLSRPVVTVRDLYDMLHELRITPRYALSSLEGEYFITNSCAIVESAWAVARSVAIAHPALTADLPMMPQPHRYVHDELLCRFTWGFNAAETLSALDLLVSRVARHVAPAESDVEQMPAPPAVPAGPIATPTTGYRPSDWPDEKCPVDVVGQTVTIYGQPIRRLGNRQRQFVDHLRQKFPAGVTKGSLIAVGIDNPHSVIKTLHKNPLWRAVLQRPVNWGDGYRIVHAV